MASLKVAPSALLVALPLLSFSAQAAEFPVSTVQGLRTALTQAATNGEDDTITLGAGVYQTDVPLSYDSNEDRTLTLRGTGGGVILDGGHGTRVLMLRTRTAHSHITVQNITIRNGYVSNPDQAAGALIWTQSANITVVNSEIADNRGSHIFFTTNAAGLLCKIENTGTVLVQGCSFHGNYAKGTGGGLYGNVGVGSSIILVNNIFDGNEGTNGGGGAYLSVIDGTVTVTNNTFAANKTGFGTGGGAIYGLLYSQNARANIYNNVFWGNTADNLIGSDLYLSDDGDGDGAGARMNVYNNDVSDFEYGDGDQLSASGNFSQDPLLTGARRLAAGSPCINAGLATAPSVPAVDFEGDARTGNPDVGADEYVGLAGRHLSVSPDPLPFGNVGVGDTSQLVVTLSSTGNADLSISSITVFGNDAAEFALNVNGGPDPLGSTSPVLAPGTGGTLVLTFLPSSAGPKSAELRVASDDSDSPLTSIVINATATAGACSVDVTPVAAYVGSAGGSGAVDVSVANGCPNQNYSSASDSAWLHITQGGSGTGSGTINYSFDVNSSVTGRTGTITVSTGATASTFSLNQSGQGQVCSYSIEAFEQSYPDTGGAAAVSVTAGGGCVWSAASGAEWVHFSPQGGMGSGSTLMRVDPNPDATSRDTSVNVAGTEVTITQAAHGAGAAPTISKIASKTGKPGSSATVAGERFSSKKTDDLVYFAGKRAKVKRASATKLTVTIPKKCPKGSVEVYVVVKGSRSNTVHFTVK